MSKRYQIAALPLRRVANRTEVLLVTSRDTGRWVVPKGWPWRNVPDHEAAAGEAWEEAGVRGRVKPKSIGDFTYAKRRDSKSFLVKVFVFVLEVKEVASSWPERGERRRRWFTAAKAAEAVDEAGLKEILLSLVASKGALGRSRQSEPLR
jgi:8-oxo-dGTP pyrophosphatase MutT (NUDIX family)